MKHEKARRQVLGMSDDPAFLLSGNADGYSNERSNANGAPVRPGMRRRVTGSASDAPSRPLEGLSSTSGSSAGGAPAGGRNILSPLNPRSRGSGGLLGFAQQNTSNGPSRSRSPPVSGTRLPPRRSLGPASKQWPTAHLTSCSCFFTHCITTISMYTYGLLCWRLLHWFATLWNYNHAKDCTSVNLTSCVVFYRCHGKSNHNTSERNSLPLRTFGATCVRKLPSFLVLAKVMNH